MEDLGEIEFMTEEENRGGVEGEGVEKHKSVILHLIKQVKIGMDLTRGTYLYITICPIRNLVYRYYSNCWSFSNNHQNIKILIKLII